MRRVLVGSILAAAAGSSAARRAWSGAGSEQIRLGEQTGPDRRPLPRQVEVVDRPRGGTGPVPPTRIARSPRPAMSAAARRYSRWNSATVKSHDGSTRSSRWCGTACSLCRRRLGGADVHPAVDLHRVDRQQLDVAELLGDCQRDRGLPRRGRPDDRDAAGRARVTARRRGCAACGSARRELDEPALEVVRRAVRDLDRGVAAGAHRRRRVEVDELVLPGAAGGHRRVLLHGPSTRTSSTRPTRASWLGAAPSARRRSCRRWKRSPATAGSTKSIRPSSAASVPGRGEKMNM